MNKQNSTDLISVSAMNFFIWNTWRFSSLAAFHRNTDCKNLRQPSKLW